MKKIFTILSVSLALVAQPAFAAQNYAENFAGLAATVGLGFASSQSQPSYYTISHS